MFRPRYFGPTCGDVQLPSFVARQAFQGAPGAFRPFELQRATDLGVMQTDVINFGGCIDHTIGTDRIAAAPEINTKHAISPEERWGPYPLFF